ncbi:MAG: Sec-independent protein translocase protein TatB [Albidovulum sp.]|nr:Sec-independent protein translocase protein TatB [Albidovulum sp.]MDE0531728.1 Sec-independent protein translocase protein TatB [Albidovulum sp.]
MFDIGWSELLIIGIVALIVVGPKDLPGMFRALGRFTGKMRGMAREFQRAMNQAADESGVKDIAKDIKIAASPKKFGLDSVRSAAKEFQQGLTTGDSSSPKNVPNPSDASASTRDRKGDDPIPETPAADSASAAAQAETEIPASNVPNPLDIAPSEYEADSDDEPSASAANAGATDSETADKARKAKSDS